MPALAGIDQTWLVKFIRDQLTQNPLPAAAIRSSELPAPAYDWQEYVPIMSASGGGTPGIGNGQLAARYVQIGPVVYTYGALDLGSTTNFGSGTLLLSLPVPAAAISVYGSLPTVMGGPCGAVEVSQISNGSNVIGQVIVNDTGRFAFVSPTSTSNNISYVSGGPSPWPSSWGNGHTLNWQFVYEAAA